MAIRSAIPSDAADIARIHVETWRVAYSGIVPDTYLASLSIADREKRWSKSLSASAEGTQVAVDANGKVVGWISFGPSRDEDGAGVGEIYAIYLNHSHWGRGIGRLLMEDVVSRLLSKGYQFITLWVLKDNNRTRTFYEKCGFTHDGSSKSIEIGGKSLLELRYRTLALQDDRADAPARAAQP